MKCSKSSGGLRRPSRGVCRRRAQEVRGGSIPLHRVLVAVAILIGVVFSPIRASSDPLAEVREVIWTFPEAGALREKAAELRSAPAIYEFVRNELAFQPYEGSRRLSFDAFDAREGNDVDLATVLIAMLRSRGIPARYAVGRIEVPETLLADWLKTISPRRAYLSALVRIDDETTNISGNVSFEHVWVQARVPMDDYRGAGGAVDVDCGSEPERCVWVDLDPSFKLHDLPDPAELVDVSNVVSFDYEAYYHAEDPLYPDPEDGIVRGQKGPVEIFEEQILHYLRTTEGLEGKTLDDVIFDGPIIPVEHGLLPASLPYRVLPAEGSSELAIRTFDSIDEHDAAMEPWAKYIDFEVLLTGYPKLNGLRFALDEPIPLALLCSKDLTLTLESTNFSNSNRTKEMVVRLGGLRHQTLFEIDGSEFRHGDEEIDLGYFPPDEGSPFTLYVTLDANNGYGNGMGSRSTIDVEYPDLVLGGHYLIAAGGEASNPSRVHQAAQRLLEANDRFPSVEHDGVLYLDEDRDGYDVGDDRLLESPFANSQLTGAVLGVAKALYFARTRRDQERIMALQRSTAGISGFLGVVSTVQDVHAVDGTAFSIVPTGLLVDMKGMRPHYPYRLDAPLVRNPAAFRLAGHAASANEHEIWQELTGYEAVSTVRGIQMAIANGAELLVLGEDQKSELPEVLEKFGFETEFPSDDFEITWLEMFNAKLFMPRSKDSEERALDVMREHIDEASPTWQKTAWSLKMTETTSDVEKYFRGHYFAPIADLNELYSRSYRSLPGGQSIKLCNSVDRTSNILELIDDHWICFWEEAESNSPIGHYIRSFDVNQGFEIDDFIFRAKDSDAARHVDVAPIAELRNDIALGVTSNHTVEHVMPTEVARGELFDLNVGIRRLFDPDGLETGASYRIDQADGGWVSGITTFDVNDPFDISFSNSTFWAKSLNSNISNSIFTPSTVDPISTVSGNMYHDETDIRIKGRSGFDYVFSRTYNSNPTQSSDAGVPIGSRWTHSYNMRLIANDYGREPNSPDDHARDGVVSSITYVDERGGEHLYSNCIGELDRIDGRPAEPRGWLEIVCDLGVLEAGSHAITLGAFNSQKSQTGEVTRLLLDDVAVEVDARSRVLFEAGFDADSEGFEYLDDAFGTAEPGYAHGAFAPGEGATGGGLKIELGGGDDETIVGISGGWTRAFDLEASTRATIRYRYKLDLAPQYEDHEYSELMMAVDGVRVDPSDVTRWRARPPRGDFEALDLSGAASHRYVVRFRNGTEYHFGDADLSVVGAVARLLEIRDTDGNALQLDWSGDRLVGIVDNLGIPGRTGLELSYDADGRLRAIADWTARVWSYAYDTRGNLISVANPLGEVTRYRYDEDAPQLIEIARDLDGDGDEETLTTFQYYENGRAFGNRNALGDGEYVEYDLFRKRTRVSDPRGHVTSHHYDEHGELVKLMRPDGGMQTFASQTDGRRYRKTSAKGFETQYSYCRARSLDGCASDTGGNVTLELDPLANRTEYDYDTTLHDALVRTTRSDGSKEIRTYYESTDPAIGAVRGKLHEVRLAELGGREDVLLARTHYNADGTISDFVEFIDPDEPTRRRTTHYEYDRKGLDLSRVRIVGSSGDEQAVTITYDALGRPLCESTSRRTSPTDATPLRVERCYEYDALGRVIRETDPAGNQIETDYYPNARVKEQRERFLLPDGSTDTRLTARYVYDDANRLTEARDVFGNTTRSRYDAASHVVEITDPVGTTLFYEYDEMGNRVAARDQNGHRVTHRYDADDRLVETTDPNGNVMSFRYDALGRKSYEVDPLGNTTRFEYDAVGRMTSRIDANAVADPSRLNSLGATVHYDYDELGRLIEIVDASDHSTRFEYDLLGNRTRVVDAKGQETVFVYDDLGRLIGYRGSGDANHEAYEYDEVGNLIRSTDRAGRVVEHTYDVLDRLVRTDLPASGRSFERAYDVYGNLRSVSTPEISYAYAYDSKNRMTSLTDERFGRGMSFSYDAADRLVRKVGYEGDVTELLYDATGRLIAERNSDFLQVSYRYDPAGRLRDRLLSSGASTHYEWNAAGRLLTLSSHTADATPVSHTTYAYDAVGNVVSRDDGSGAVQFTYDPLYRLTKADYPDDVKDRSLTYDSVGNRLTETSVRGTRHYTYLPGNRLAEISADFEDSIIRFEYDPNGAVVRKRIQEATGDRLTIYELERDEFGRITRASGPGFPLNSFEYDPAGLRVRRRDSQGDQLFHLEGESAEVVYGPSADRVHARYLRGTAVDEVVTAYLYDAHGDPAAFTYHHDPLMSVLGLSGHDGTITDTLEFGPFGEQLHHTGTSPNTLRYTGREQDPDTGLYYYRARYYDPEIGRFLSEDPIRFEGGINFYAYAQNNPVSSSDPTGLRQMLLGGSATGIIGVGVSIAGGIEVGVKDTGLRAGQLDVGAFVEFGTGTGLDLNFGGLVGVTSNAEGASRNVSLPPILGVIPHPMVDLVSANFSLSPTSGDVKGGDLVIGPSFGPGSISDSVAYDITAREAWDWFSEPVSDISTHPVSRGGWFPPGWTPDANRGGGVGASTVYLK